MFQTKPHRKRRKIELVEKLPDLFMYKKYKIISFEPAGEIRGIKFFLLVKQLGEVTPGSFYFKQQAISLGQSILLNAKFSFMKIFNVFNTYGDPSRIRVIYHNTGKYKNINNFFINYIII